MLKEKQFEIILDSLKKKQVTFEELAVKLTYLTIRSEGILNSCLKTVCYPKFVAAPYPVLKPLTFRTGKVT